MPLYQDLGRTEKELRQDKSYAEPWKELPLKKTCTQREWKKTSIIPNIDENPIEQNVFRENESALALDPNVIYYKSIDGTQE